MSGGRVVGPVPGIGVQSRARVGVGREETLEDMTAAASRAAGRRRRLRAMSAALPLLVLVSSCGDASTDSVPRAASGPATPAATTPATTAPTTGAPADGDSGTGPAAGSDAADPGAAAGERGAPATDVRPPGGSPAGEPPGPVTAEPPPAADAAAGAGSTRFAVVGDSITAGFAPTEGTAVRDRNSWIPAADRDERLTFAGGYAVPGATTTVMRNGVTPVAADVLVVMAGTNDLGTGMPWETTRDNLVQIVATAGVPVVTLSAVPPRDDAPEAVVELNDRLAQLAAEQGWGFVDPWPGLSEGGAWVAGTTDDGIHPVEQVVSLVGQRLAVALVAAG